FVSRRKLWLTNSCWNTRTVSVKSRRLPAAYQIRYKVSVQIHGWRGCKVGRVQAGKESGVRKLNRVIPGRHVARSADLGEGMAMNGGSAAGDGTRSQLA